MRYPEFLKSGGTIGLIAPSFGCTTDPYRDLCTEAIRRFEADGYRVVCGPNVREEKGIGKSNTPEACAAEIDDFFTSGKADVLISAGGGETMCEDLSFVDFDAIRNAPPKWFMGYSDNTNLVLTLPTLCDTAAVYGPCVSDFAQSPRHEAVDDAFRVLTGECLTARNYKTWEREKHPEGSDIYLPYNATEPNRFRIYEPDGNGGLAVHFPRPKNAETRFSGRLIGGCLDILATLVGTRFDGVKDFLERYRDDGVIWFFEACELSPLDVRRCLWQLSEAGWFEGANGFLAGRPMRFGEEMIGMNMYNAVTGILGQYNVPVLMDLDIGHLPPMMPLVAGSFATVTAKTGALKIEMELI
ncbi:MAG: LD-carboxypeptidase [Firmicutes bacterium]|nr:LD-carboxypeptidase [Bacillota bacterium]